MKRRHYRKTHIEDLAKWIKIDFTAHFRTINYQKFKKKTERESLVGLTTPTNQKDNADFGDVLESNFADEFWKIQEWSSQRERK